MEVLRHGNTYREVECKKCGALLSYCDKDLQQYVAMIGSDRIYKKGITCPECRAIIWFSPEFIDRKEV